MDLIIQQIADALERARIEIAAQISAKGLTASGETAASMRVEIEPNGAKLTGRGYFGTLETGRRPGNVPSDITEILKKWAIDKGINITQIPYKRQPSLNWTPKYSVEERSINAFAGAVAHTIMKRGTKLYREGGDPTVYTPVIDRIITELQNNIFQIVVSNINTN